MIWNDDPSEVIIVFFTWLFTGYILYLEHVGIHIVGGCTGKQKIVVGMDKGVTNKQTSLCKKRPLIDWQKSRLVGRKECLFRRTFDRTSLNKWTKHHLFVAPKNSFFVALGSPRYFYRRRLYCFWWGRYWTLPLGRWDATTAAYPLS